MKKTKDNAITLIALIITVIIMSILAGVAINLTIGENGIFNKTVQAGELYKNATENERSELDKLVDELNLKSPSIEIEGEMINGYYVGEVKVVINGVVEGKFRTAKLKYTIDGENYKGIEGINHTFTINEDGNYTIIAYMVDNFGIESDLSQKREIIRDATPPSKASVHYVSNTTNTISVTAEGEDGLTGVKDYIYQYKISSANDEDEQWSDATITEETQYTYSDTIIQAGNTYDLRVVVRDKAENRTASGKITVITNRVPEIEGVASGTVRAASTKSANDIYTIDVKVKAKDADNDTLYYTLYWGQNENNLVAQTPEEKASGQEITFTKSGLANHTTYYWKVEVTDRKSESIPLGAGSTKTYCKTTQCTSYSTATQTCTDCFGYQTSGGHYCSGKLTRTYRREDSTGESGGMSCAYPRMWSL